MGLLIAVSVYSQKIPIFEPYLLPLPSISGGISYFSLIPTQNLYLASSPVGWTIADTLRGFVGTLDIEFMRYRWGDKLLKSPRYDAYSSLGYSFFNHFGSLALPSNYPSSFELGHVPVSGFSLNLLVKEIYLDNRFIYNYSHRGNLHASLGVGLTSLKAYKMELVFA